MNRVANVVGLTLLVLGYVYSLVMLWLNVIQWWGTSAIWAFVLSPVLALFIPLIAWIVEGTFPVLLFAGWGAMILGVIIAAVTNKD